MKNRYKIGCLDNFSRYFRQMTILEEYNNKIQRVFFYTFVLGRIIEKNYLCIKRTSDIIILSMKSIRFILFYIFLFSILPLHAEYFRKIGLPNGLTQPSVMSICQDNLGRMWFGTLEGLNVYDGNRVTPMKGWVQDADSTVWLGNNIIDLRMDQRGDLFFLADFNLMKYEVKTEKLRRLSSVGRTSAIASYKGQIWYVSQDTLFSLDPETSEKKMFAKLNQSRIANTLLVNEEKIYIGFRHGMLILDRKTKKPELILKDENVRCIYESQNKELWIGTRMNGLYRMTPDGKFSRIPYICDEDVNKNLKSSQIRQFVEDDNHNIWIGTFDGLYKYDSKEDEYRLIQIPEKVGGLTHPSIYSLYKDKQGIIWVGTYYGGVNFFDPKKDSYAYYEYDLVAQEDLYYSYIGDMLFDKNDCIWVCTDGGGVTCMDKNWKVIHQFTSGDKKSLLHNNVKCIAYDEKREHIYVGTYLGGLSRYDMKTGQFHHYLHDYRKGYAYPDEIVNYMKLKDDKLFMLANNGLFLLDLETQNFTKFKIPSKYCLDLGVDDDGVVYVTTWNGFIYFDVNNPQAKKEVVLNEKDCRSMLTRILVTSDGVYFTTLGSGVIYFNKKTKEISRFTSEKGHLLSNFCYNICQNKDGNILISSDKGVSLYNTETKAFRSINLTRIFKNNHIINKCGLISNDGLVYVGGTQGVVTLEENEFKKTNRMDSVPDFYFSRLIVEGQLIYPGDNTGILDSSIAFTSSLNLKHDQNNFYVGFALSDYEQKIPERSFLYKLEGSNKEWIKTNEMSVRYTNLDPGNYTLRVVMLINGQRAKEIQLDICVASPWYNTWIAWIVYILFFVVLLNYILANRVAKRTLSLKLENERSEKLHIAQLNHEKLVFFTNVSHEFRTPLTLLMSHVDILLQKHSFSPTIYNQLLKIRKNAEQMNNLISELLEFRKLTQNHQKLQVKQQDMSAFLKEIFLPFVDYAGQRRITYENHFPIEPVSCTFDEHLLEKVVYNLLSNAFKYTSDGGKIIISGKTTADTVEISVSDNGVGLSEKDVSQIFVRFYQGDNQQKVQVQSPGTGIGLALCKVIVEKHHGTISVRSIVGEGSVFTVRLPRSLEAYRSDDQIEWMDGNQEKSYVVGSMPSFDTMLSDETLKSLDENHEENFTEVEKKHTVLLVEDNVELLQILQDLFSPLYQVVTATNGEEGLQKVYECKVDLIISDIMMPKMTGTEMCLQLKNNIDYCHIPIILLTALDSTERNIEGLSRGADDYVTKPFHAGLLLARANNLIRSRLLIQHQFEKRPMSEIDLTSINPLDKDLLKKVTTIIEEHIDDPLFDIPLLCKELGISRSLIYAKFKALTGMTPNNFILNFRLKHAATLLKQYKDMPISEVSDRSGFNSPVYFSQCFKKQFGMTPHNYKKEHMDEK